MSFFTQRLQHRGLKQATLEGTDQVELPAECSEVALLRQGGEGIAQLSWVGVRASQETEDVVMQARVTSLFTGRDQELCLVTYLRPCR